MLLSVLLLGVSNPAFSDELNLFMSASHASDASPVPYMFRVYQSEKPGDWVLVNDGSTVHRSYPANSVSGVEISITNAAPYYGILDSMAPFACHNFFPVGDPDEATFDFKNFFDVWGGYIPVRGRLNKIKFDHGNLSFGLISLGQALCNGPASDCAILDCFAIKNDTASRP